MERVPAPVTVNEKLPVVKAPDATKEKVPCAPKKVPVPELMVAFPEMELEDVAVAVEVAFHVLPSPNVTTKVMPTDCPPPAVPLTVMVVGP
jgi:hypothetical protein